MITKAEYKVGHIYNEYNNLDRVGLYPKAGSKIEDNQIAVYRYIDRFYNATLRFMREEGETGYRWRLTEIWDSYQHRGLIKLPTESKPNPNKDIGSRVIDLMERLAKL